MLNNHLHYLQGNFSAKASNSLLLVLLCVDVIFILGHILVIYGAMGSTRNFNLDYDGGYPELFQYAKYLLITLLIAYLVFGLKSYSYIPWLGLFVLLGFDDAFGLHERFGWQFAHRLNLNPAMGLRAVDLGEIVYAIIAGTLFLGVLRYFYLRGTKRFMKTSWDISILFAILLFFGVVVDMIHSFFESAPILESVLTIIEDGGEMIALSLLVWYFYFLVQHYSEERNFLYCVFTPVKKSDLKPKA